MTDPTEQDEEHEAPKGPRVSRWAIVRSVAGALFGVGLVMALLGSAVLIYHPETPLLRAWNPMADLRVADPVTPLTQWKLRRAMSDPLLCVEILQTSATARALDPREDSDDCHIRNRVSLEVVGGNTSVAPVLGETSCSTALRFAMWNRHGVQPAARDILGTDVAVIRQIGSYNCRPINTTSGPSSRWSTHATGDAIDITGFDLSDGRRIRLIEDWDGEDSEAAFLRAVRDAACTWFGTTLGPDFNSLHADHFHLQNRGWGTCR